MIHRVVIPSPLNRKEGRDTVDYPLHTTGTSYAVGKYLVTIPQHDDEGFRIMENFGSYRMLKKPYKTLESAIKRAETLN